MAVGAGGNCSQCICRQEAEHEQEVGQRYQTSRPTLQGHTSSSQAPYLKVPQTSQRPYQLGAKCLNIQVAEGRSTCDLRWLSEERIGVLMANGRLSGVSSDLCGGQSTLVLWEFPVIHSSLTAAACMKRLREENSPMY